MQYQHPDPAALRPEIPHAFYSEFTGRPFERCIECDENLLAEGTGYGVQKHFSGDEPVFEMAICAGCSSKMAQEMSEESRQSIERFLDSGRRGSPVEEGAVVVKIEGDLNQAKLETVIRDPHLLMIQACLFCGRPRGECGRYSVAGIFSGNRTIITPGMKGLQFPMMVCDDCTSGMNDGLSRQTRDSFNRFMDRNFDGPPGLHQDTPRPDFVLV